MEGRSDELMRIVRGLTPEQMDIVKEMVGILKESEMQKARWEKLRKNIVMEERSITDNPEYKFGLLKALDLMDELE